MTAVATPIQVCFSRDGMEGSYYHELHYPGKGDHTFHRYDRDGYYVMHSTQSQAKLANVNDFYLSDTKGNRLVDSQSV